MTGLSKYPVGRSARLRAACAALLLVLPLCPTAVWAADRPVADAAERGDVTAVQQLLRGGADVNMTQGDGMSALHWAAERGDTALTRILIYAGANVDAGTRIGRYTPLHIAARGGHAEVVKFLLAAGADAMAKTTNSGATPLHLAAASGDMATIAALIDAGADVNAREAAWGQTPLIFAAGEGRLDAVKALIAGGADASMTSWAVDTVEREKADRASEKRLMEFLAEFKEREGGGNDWQPAPSQVQAAIDAAREIQRNWPNVPMPGEEDKADKGKTDEEGNQKAGEANKETAEEPASGGPAKQPREAVVYNADAQPVYAPSPNAEGQGGEQEAESETKAPVTYNADGQPVYQNTGGDKDKEDEPKPPTYGELVGSWGGLAPLHHAVRQGYTEVAMALIDAGADINQPTAGDHTTPLLMAAINGQFDLALKLLQRGADPNLASDAGTTPLFAVLERNWAPKSSYAHPVEHEQQQATHIDVMKALLDAGADPNKRLKEPLWYMEFTFSVLGQAGIHYSGATPFWRAAQALDVDAMKLLYAHGADPNIPTVKLPERKRRNQEEEKEKPKSEEGVKLASAEGAAAAPTEDKAGEAAEEKSEKAKKAEDEDEYADEDEEEEDHSGVPPVPVGGPFIYPIHAAAGAGYGQYFAGNAHRHVPNNWLAAVKFLVEVCGADVNLRDANANTPLHHAASRGDDEMVRYLVSKGADVMAVNRKGQTTVDMANGPIQRVPPYPSTIALLESLGAENNHKCLSC